MIKAVFIDEDNTLLSFEAFVKETMRTGFARFGLPAYREEMYDGFHRVHSALWQQIEAGELSVSQMKKVRWNLVFDALGVQGDGPAFEAYFDMRLKDSAICEPGAMELVRYLAEKYILCVASNGPYEQAVNRLRVGGLLPYFTHTFISERIGAAKPAKEFFERSFAILNADGGHIAPEETVIIGDSLTSDMAGGQAYGMRTCYYNPKKKPLPEGQRPDYIVTHLLEIKNIL